jgi:hypothetical protein
MTPSSDFPEKGMTFTQFAQSVIPGLSDADAHDVLWERTPFPMVQGRDDLMPYLLAERERRDAEHA